MEPGPHFEVTVRRKIPYLTTFLFYLTITFFLALMVIYLFFFPVRNAPADIKAAYFMFLTPNFVKYGLVISLAGALVMMQLYYTARLYRKGLLTFWPEKITIQGEKVNVEMPIKSIRKVFCMDHLSDEGEPTGKLAIYFQQGRWRKQGIRRRTTRVRLIDYSRSEEFMDRLMKYDGIKFAVYNYDTSPDIENEE